MILRAHWGSFEMSRLTDTDFGEFQDAIEGAFGYSHWAVLVVVLDGLGRPCVATTGVANGHLDDAQNVVLERGRGCVHVRGFSLLACAMTS